MNTALAVIVGLAYVASIAFTYKSLMDRAHGATLISLCSMIAIAVLLGNIITQGIM